MKSDHCLTKSYFPHKILGLGENARSDDLSAAMVKMEFNTDNDGIEADHRGWFICWNFLFLNKYKATTEVKFFSLYKLTINSRKMLELSLNSNTVPMNMVNLLRCIASTMVWHYKLRLLMWLILSPVHLRIHSF